MPSRRKIWSKVNLTVLVPAPEEPMTEMMGCLMDIYFSSVTTQTWNRPRSPNNGDWRALKLRIGIIGGDARDFFGRAEDQRRALVQGRRRFWPGCGRRRRWRRRPPVRPAWRSGRPRRAGAGGRFRNPGGHRRDRETRRRAMKMRCASPTRQAIQRMLKSLPRGPVAPSTQSSMKARIGAVQWR